MSATVPSTSSTLEHMLSKAHECSLEYTQGLRKRPVYPDDAALRALSEFDRPLPEAGRDGDAILEELHRLGSPATVATTSGRYFGFVNGGAIPVAVAAKWLATVWDQAPVFFVLSPTAAKLEDVCEGWLVDLFGLPAGTAMGLVEGATSANFCGMAAARWELLRRRGWNVNTKGLYGAPSLRVVVGEQVHGSVLKALALLGLGSERVERVPVDAQGRINASALPRLDETTLVITQAGNVDSGSFDPLEEICGAARSANAWVHVDGAFGLWAAASPSRRGLLKGVQMADSWATDAHKTLNVPYDNGIVLCRDRRALVSSLQARGAYLQFTEGQRDGMLYSPGMSRRARSVDLWAALASLGRTGVAEIVDRLCERALLFAELLSAAGFRILNDVVFNQVLVAADSEETTSHVLEQVQRSGVCWCGGTTWMGERAIRLSVSTWTTTEEDIRRSAATFAEALGALR